MPRPRLRPSPAPLPPDCRVRSSQSPFDSSPLLLRQFQYLPSGRLDRLVGDWLASLGFRSVRPWERRGTISTYEAEFGGGPCAVPARVRVHQRLRHLELSHVESFLGHLVRSGSPIGILVTPGECSWAAGLGARTPRLPFLRLCGGAEWAEELEAARIQKSEAEDAESLRKRSQIPAYAASDGTFRREPAAAADARKGEWRGGYRIW